MNNAFEHIDSNKYLRDISLLQPVIKKNKTLANIMIVCAIILAPLMLISIIANIDSGELSGSTVVRYLVGIALIITGITNYTGKYKPIKKSIEVLNNEISTGQFVAEKTNICEIQLDPLTNYFRLLKGEEKTTVDQLFIIKTNSGAVYKCNRLVNIPVATQVNVPVEIVYYANSKVVKQITVI